MKICLKLIYISAFFLFPVLTFGAQNIYYVTQTGAGSHDGKTISNAWSVSDFNSSSNWSSNDNSSKIDPGDTVYFSGTITTQIFIMGSGLSYNYITLDGTSAQINTNMSSIGLGGLISATNRNYLKFQNFTIDGQHATGRENQAGIYIASSSGSSDYIVVDNCDITRSGNAVWLWGNVGNVTLTRNYFHHTGESGLWMKERSGEADAPHNIIFGGSSDNGNTVKNCGYKDSKWDVDGDVVSVLGDHIVISYNHLYSDSPVLSDPTSYGFTGMYMIDCRNILVEYNTIHGHSAKNHRSGINFKDDVDGSRKTGYVIIRYNKIYDEISDSSSWGGSSSGIVVGNDMEYYYVYGNYIENCGGGIYPNSGWSDLVNPNGVDGNNIYVFSNIIDTTQNFGIYLGGEPGGDDLDDVYIFNNTIYRASTDPSAGSGFDATGIYSRLQDADTENLYIKNNVIIDSRINEDDYVQVYQRKQNDLYLDYQHHYYTAGVPNINFIQSGVNRTYAWNSVGLPAGYGDNDTEGNPLLSNPANGDFTISSPDSPLINSGIDLGHGVINTIAIHGKYYPVEWNTALAPNTDWSTIPPTIVVAKQDQHGSSWEKGAYVYIENGDGSSLEKGVVDKIENGGSMLPPSSFRITKP